MLKAEWENWVWGEANKCRQTAAILKKGDGDSDMQGLKTWFEGYCGSCLDHVEDMKGL
jgi:hypothetical protein